MLEFVNNNATFCTIVSSVITALLSALVAIIINHRKSKLDTVNHLRKELETTKDDLEKCRRELSVYQSVEETEKRIDKRTGGIYTEFLQDGQTRNICAFCWENRRKKSPISVSADFDPDTGEEFYIGYCNSCQSRCVENLSPLILQTDSVTDEELPF